MVSLNLRMLFSRLGMSHLIAISGFHFSILIGALTLMLRRVNRRIVLLLLVVVASLYFALVGGFASIKRAYLMLLVLLAGEFFKLESQPINTLGACLLCMVIWEPVIVLNLGFQLSFLATFSILLFHEPIDQLFCSVIEKRGVEEVKELNLVSQAGYVFFTAI